MNAAYGLDRVCPDSLYVSATHEITLMPDNILSPKRIAAEAFTDAVAAVARLAEIYERNISFLRAAFEAYVGGEPLDARVRATYPFVRITTATHARLDSRLSYGFVSGPGMYETSVTRPDLFRAYFTEQIGLLIRNHGVPVEIGESDEPIPIHFAYRRDINIAASLPARDRPLRDLFDTPDLATIDVTVAPILQRLNRHGHFRLDGNRTDRGRADAQFQARDIGFLGLPPGQHFFAVMRLNPIAQKARWDRQAHHAFVHAVELHPPEPACKHVVPEFGTQLVFYPPPALLIHGLHFSRLSRSKSFPKPLTQA